MFPTGLRQSNLFQPQQECPTFCLSGSLFPKNLLSIVSDDVHFIIFGYVWNRTSENKRRDVIFTARLNNRLINFRLLIEF